MPLRARPYLLCLSVAVGFFFLATFGGDVVARVTIAGQTFADAISEHTHYALVEPVGTAILLAPFLLVGWMAASLGRRDRPRRGLWLLLVGGSVLSLICVSGYRDSERYMAQRMWTAASLAVGFLPFETIPLLLACLIAYLFMRRRGHVES